MNKLILQEFYQSFLFQYKSMIKTILICSAEIILSIMLIPIMFSSDTTGFELAGNLIIEVIIFTFFTAKTINISYKKITYIMPVNIENYIKAKLYFTLFFEYAVLLLSIAVLNGIYIIFTGSMGVFIDKNSIFMILNFFIYLFIKNIVKIYETYALNQIPDDITAAHVFNIFFLFTNIMLTRMLADNLLFFIIRILLLFLFASYGAYIFRLAKKMTIAAYGHTELIENHEADV